VFHNLFGMNHDQFSSVAYYCSLNC